jgi:hypothetical protein
MPTKSSKAALEIIERSVKKCYLMAADEWDDEDAVSPCIRLPFEAFPARTAKKGDK